MALALTTVAEAASFDCSKVTTKVEKLICGDSELSKLDENLKSIYQQYASQASARLSIESIRLDEAEWVRQRNRCPDTSCIRDEYEMRIAQLSANSKFGEVQNSADYSSTKSACQVVSQFAARGDLSGLIARDADFSPPDIGELSKVFGKAAGFSSGNSDEYRTIDLESNGIPYHFIITSDGTMNINTAYAIAVAKGATVKTVDDTDDGYSTLSLLKVGNRYYILSSSGSAPTSLGKSNLGKLWRMGGHGEFEPVCKFSQGNADLVVGKQNPVCSEVASGRIKYVEYPFKHALSSSESAPWSVDPLEGLARVDIDNDGIAQNVVRTQYSSSAGAGCDFTDVAVTNEEKTNIPNSKLNQLLRGLDGFSCGAKKDIFVYRGTTYIDSHGESGNRVIHRIRHGHDETICKFQGTFTYEMHR